MIKINTTYYDHLKDVDPTVINSFTIELDGYPNCCKEEPCTMPGDPDTVSRVWQFPVMRFHSWTKDDPTITTIVDFINNFLISEKRYERVTVQDYLKARKRELKVRKKYPQFYPQYKDNE